MYEFWVSLPVELLEPGISFPDQLFGFMLNNPSIQLIIKPVQKAVNKRPSMSVPVDFFSFLMLYP